MVNFNVLLLITNNYSIHICSNTKSRKFNWTLHSTNYGFHHLYLFVLGDIGGVIIIHIYRTMLIE